MGHDDLKFFMLNIVRQIGLLDLEEMRVVNEDAKRSRQKWDGIGVMLDPTYYMNSMHDGTFDSAALQAEIVDHLIAIRELAGKLDTLQRKHHPEAYADGDGEGS